MGIGEWLTKGWENYKNNAVTYIVLQLLFAIALGIVTFALGVGLMPIFAGHPQAPNYVHLGTSLIVAVILITLIAVYFQAAILYTAKTGNATVGDALAAGGRYFLPLLGVAIVNAVAVLAPVVVGLLLAAAVPAAAPLFVALGLLAALYVAIRLITAGGRVLLDKGVGEAISEAWNTPIGKSVELLITMIIAGFVNGIVAIIPFIGWIVSLLVTAPWSQAVYMEAVKDIAKA